MSTKPKVSVRVFLTIDVTDLSFEVLNVGVADKLDDMRTVTEKLTKEQAESLNVVFESLLTFETGR